MGGKLFEELYGLLEGEKYGSDESRQGTPVAGQSLRDRVYEEAIRQQKIAENWARKNNCLVLEPNDYFDEIYGDSELMGSEAKVWYDSRRNLAIKNITLNHYPNLKALFDRIFIHNSAFSSTAMTSIGIGTSDEGISVIVEQPWIADSNEIPTFEEIDKYLTEKLNFTHSRGFGSNADYTKNGYLVTDLRPENVIKQPNGGLAVIDCFAKFQSA